MLDMRNRDFGNVGSEILTNLHVLGTLQYERHLFLGAHVPTYIWMYVSLTPKRLYGHENLGIIYRSTVGMNIQKLGEGHFHGPEK
jgi:hypothetical protein